MKKAILLVLLFGFPMVAELLEGADSPSFQVIVNAANPVSVMTKAQISNLFLKKTTTWENGRKVLPVDQADSASVRKSFSNLVHGRNAQVVLSYWQQQIFSGRGVPPVEKSSDHEVLAYVQQNADAVGYVTAGTPGIEEVKVIKLIDNGP